MVLNGSVAGYYIFIINKPCIAVPLQPGKQNPFRMMLVVGNIALLIQCVCDA